MSFFSKLFGRKKTEETPNSAKTAENPKPIERTVDTPAIENKTNFIMPMAEPQNAVSSSAPDQVQEKRTPLLIEGEPFESSYSIYEQSVLHPGYSMSYKKPFDAPSETGKRLQVKSDLNGIPVRRIWFFSSNAFEEIILPGQLEVLEKNVFSRLEHLRKMVIPDHVKVLPEELFYLDTHLEEVILQEGLESIGKNCFSGCSLLSFLDIPSSVNFIDPLAFDENPALKEIRFPKGNSTYSVKGCSIYSRDGKTIVRVFNCLAQDLAADLEGVEEIGSSAFENLAQIKKVVVPEGVKVIQKEAFANTGLTEIHLPASVMQIGEGAFRDCRKLVNFVLDPKNPYFVYEDGVLYDHEKTRAIWANKAFRGNYYAPSTLKRVENGCFDWCFFLMGAYFKEGLISLGIRAFYGERKMSLNQLLLPVSLTKIDGYQVTPKTLKEVYYAGSEESFLRIEGLKMNSSIRKAGIFYSERGPLDLKNRYWHYAEDGLTPVIWGAEAKVRKSEIKIEDPTLLGSVGLHFALTEDQKGYIVTGIEGGAGNKGLIIPPVHAGLPVVEIGPEAFKEKGDWEENCSHIRSLILPEGLLRIDHAAFQYCSKLQGVILPRSLESMDKSVFSGCKALEWIVFPGKVKTLLNANFNDCERLADVFYWGDINEAKALEIAFANDSFCQANLYFYSEKMKENHNDEMSYWHFNSKGEPVSWHQGDLSFRNLSSFMGTSEAMPEPEEDDTPSEASGIVMESTKKKMVQALIKKGANPEQAKWILEHTSFINSHGSRVDEETEGEYSSWDTVDLYNRASELAGSGDYKQALHFFELAAAKDNPEADECIGDFYLRGIGCQKNEKKGLEAYLKAAEEGWVPVYGKIGTCYRFGLGTPIDYKESAQWYLKAALSDDYRVILGHAADLSYGTGGMVKNPQKAMFWVAYDVWEGDFRGMSLLSDGYKNGEGLPKDPIKAEYWGERFHLARFKDEAIEKTLAKDLKMSLKEAEVLEFDEGYDQAKAEKTEFEEIKAKAMAGDLASMLLLGERYLDGKGVSSDEKLGLEWIKKSADLGWAGAQANYGIFILNGSHGIKKNQELARTYFQKAADQHVGIASLYLAQIFDDKTNPAKDQTKANSYLLQGGDDHDPNAAYYCAEFYREGIHGFPKDQEKALHYYKVSAGYGHIEAMNFLATYYHFSSGTNGELGYECNSRSAALGNGIGLATFGIRLYNGTGGPKDEKRGTALLKAALRSGDEEGQKMALLFIQAMHIE